MEETVVQNILHAHAQRKLENMNFSYTLSCKDACSNVTEAIFDRRCGILSLCVFVYFSDVIKLSCYSWASDECGSQCSYGIPGIDLLVIKGIICIIVV